MINRRNFMKASIAAALATGVPGHHWIRAAYGAPAAVGLSDPAAQPLFTNLAPNAMAGAFKYVPNKANKLKITAAPTVQMTGLVGADGVTPVATPVWGYGTNGGLVSWPGRTIERNVADDPLEIKWENKLLDAAGNPVPHLLPVDTSLHWAYALHGASSVNGVDYRQFNIATNGVPLVPHVHGGKNDSPFDGNPEYFFAPGFGVTGPRWVEKKYLYGGPDWNDTAGMMWYHDHALGITRLNVYAGLAGFFPLRDASDTGKVDNPIGLPADPYELGFAVQDRMFRDTGELFYSAFPGDPFYADFIDPAVAASFYAQYPGEPTALAEFFGDHMVVNGVIWPKYSVEQRQYRVRLLNGTDSRFMRLKLKVVAAGATDPAFGANKSFLVIGSDQGLCANATEVTEVDFIPGERLDLIIDFKDVPMGSRVIIENLLGDAPFGGDLPAPEDLFPNRRTDRVMAFDVELPLDGAVPDTNIQAGTPIGPGVQVPPVTAPIRKVALFEGTDEFGRLQPLLGTAGPAVDVTGAAVNGSLTWFQPTTEAPALGATEEWEIYNATGDAHPIHLHLVHFEVLGRQAFAADVVPQPTIQHNGTTGVGFRLENIAVDPTNLGTTPAEGARRDMVTALPGQVTRIKASFEKPGRYVWHCHILSHEDHEMMRPLEVV